MFASGLKRSFWIPVVVSLAVVLFSNVVVAEGLTAADTASASRPGKFVWAELLTDDSVAAQHFYAGLLGWTFAEVDGYVTAFNQQEPVAGIVYHERPKDRQARPRWICYVSSNNLGAATKSVLAAGGSVRMPPQRIPGQGERTILADAEGALFGAIHLQRPDPEDYIADIGDWIWLQLLSRDVAQAASFYQAVGGYELFEDTDAHEAERYLLARGGYARAAILPLSPKHLHEGVVPTWLPFIRVDSVAASVAKVPALGGKVVVPPRPSLFDGRAAVIEDATGAWLGLMEWDAEPSGSESGQGGIQ